MNETVKLVKVRKSCKITATVARIFKIILTVVAVLCLVGGIICFVVRNDIDAGMADSLNKNGNVAFLNIDNIEVNGLISFTFDLEKLANEGKYAMVSIISCLIGFAYSLFIAIIFGIAESIFKAVIKNETPFDENVIKKMKVFFIVLTAVILVFSGIGGGVFTGLFCWSIYTIFDYGYEIQKEVDETL